MINPFYNAFGSKCLSLILTFSVLIVSLHANAAGNENVVNDDHLDDLFGEETESPLADSNGVSLNEFSGYIEITPRVFINDRNGFANDNQMLATAELEFDLLLTDSITGYSRPRLFFDAVDNDFQRFELFEAYLTYEQENWDIRLGQFVENWGITDTFNPVDILNRRDLSTSLLDTTRLGETGVRVRWLWNGNSVMGEPTIALYFLPWFQITRFAPDRQRLGLGNNNLSFEEKRGFEPEGQEEHFYALRFQSTLNTPILNADLQLIAAKGPDRNPVITQLDMTTLLPAYYGNQIIGAGIRAVPNSATTTDLLEGITFKLEVAYNNPYEYDNTPIAVPDSYLAYVIGFDRDFYNVVNKQDQLTITVEFASEAGVSQADETVFTRPFSRDIITRFFWQAGNFSRSSLELRGVYDLDNDEHIIESTFATSLLRLHEDLKLELSALYVSPSSDQQSTFSQLPDNTSVAATLRFDF